MITDMMLFILGGFGDRDLWNGTDLD